MMNSYRMAQTLYAKLLDDVAELQRDIVLQTLIMETFENPLPISRLLRSNSRVMTEGKETCARIIERWQGSIAEKTETILELEAMFAAHDDASIKDFAKAMAERMKRGDK